METSVADRVMSKIYPFFNRPPGNMSRDPEHLLRMNSDLENLVPFIQLLQGNFELINGIVNHIRIFQFFDVILSLTWLTLVQLLSSHVSKKEKAKSLVVVFCLFLATLLRLAICGESVGADIVIMLLTLAFVFMFLVSFFVRL